MYNRSPLMTSRHKSNTMKPSSREANAYSKTNENSTLMLNAT